MPPSVTPNLSVQSSRSDNATERTSSLDDDALMLFEDGLRAHLPSVEDIVKRAAARKRKTRTAASIAVLSLTAVLVWLDPVYQSEKVATGIGERGTWVLSDGSEVTLNTASTLRVDYHLRSRRLYLPQGEALFKVEHSRWRSFLVYAHQTTVEDIGTVFNVRNTDNGAKVTVLEGRVQVSADDTPSITRLLDAGQSVEVEGDRLSKTASVDTEAIAAWQGGKLYFDNTPLAAVVTELQRYRKGPVRLSPALSGLRITGQFDIDNIDQLLALLPTLAPVAINRDGNGGVAIVPREEKTAAAPP